MDRTEVLSHTCLRHRVELHLSVAVEALLKPGKVDVGAADDDRDASAVERKTFGSNSGHASDASTLGNEVILRHQPANAVDQIVFRHSDDAADNIANVLPRARV